MDFGGGETRVTVPKSHQSAPAPDGSPGDGGATGAGRDGPTPPPSAALAAALRSRPEYGSVFLPRTERLRRLPRLILKAVALAWRAGRRELITTTLLQLFQGLGVTAQLLLGKHVLQSVLTTGQAGGGFGTVVPSLAALVAITVLLGFASAVQLEQYRILGELVARAADDRVLDVAGDVDLEAFEWPGFFDGLQRAHVAGLSRPTQLVNGLGTITTSLVTIVGISVALVALQPLLVPFILLGYAPLWFATTRNSKALFRFVLQLTETIGSALTSSKCSRDVTKPRRFRPLRWGPSCADATTGCTTSGSASFVSWRTSAWSGPCWLPSARRG